MSEGASHPEDTCEECGGPNMVWFAPSDLWNQVMRGGDRGAPDLFGIVCPLCFVRRAEALGVSPTAWRVEPENLKSGPGQGWSPLVVSGRRKESLLAERDEARAELAQAHANIDQLLAEAKRRGE